MHRSRQHWLTYDADGVELSQDVFFDRLRELCGRCFDSPMRDVRELNALTGAHPTSAQIEDLLAHLARYLRQSYEYLEAQTLSRALEMSAACTRMIQAENGKDVLNLQAASEENR